MRLSNKSCNFCNKTLLEHFVDQNNNLSPLGIIAGAGLLPLELANIYQTHGGVCHIACIAEEVDWQLVAKFPYKFFKIGEVGGIIDYFRSLNINNIVIAGDIKRPNLATIKVDLTGSMLLACLLKEKFLGDDKLLSIVAKFLEDRGFTIIATKDILSLAKSTQKLSTTNCPTKRDEADIALGIKVIKALGVLDIGQSVIIEDGYVLGVEAAEGTDCLIARCAILRKKTSGGVLVKLMKPSQDIRLDIPTIGVTTIQQLVDFKYSGLAIAASTIILDCDGTFNLANKHQIFIKQI